MPHEVPAPEVFATLKLRFVQQVSHTEYSAACPECGGDVHQGGELPDRFRIFLDGRPRAWCRRCSYFVWPDQANGGAKPDPAQIERWRHDQIAREEARKRSAEQALKLLRDGARWECYHQQLDVTAREWWQGRGIPRAWQDFWQLGWNPQSRWGTPTATIPLFGPDWQVENVKHRLIGNDAVGQKYRYELHGLPAPLFRTDPAVPLTGQVIVVEGEIKAAVVKVTLDDNTTVVGLPGATPPQSAVSQLQEADVTLIMDPGAEHEAAELAKKLPHCRVLIPAMKIDDGVLQCRMTAKELRSTLAQARPI